MPVDGVPRLIQSAMMNNTWGTLQNLGTPIQVAALNMYLPNPSLAGNCLLVTISGWRQDGVGAPSITFSDNLGSSGWTKLREQTSPTNGYYAAIWALPNCGAGVQHITATFANDGNYVGHSLSEWCNIATTSPLDGSNSADVTSSTGVEQAGSITPGTSGALIFHFAVQDSNNTETLSYTKDTGFTLLGVDPWFGTATQFKVHTSGAINPALTSSRTDPYISIVVGLKAAQAGTDAPTTTPWISHVQWRDLLEDTSGVTSYTIQVPCPRGAGALVVEYIGAGQTVATAQVITGITDSAGNTWVVKTASLYPDTTACAQTAYALLASATDDLTVTVTFNQADTESSIIFYAVNGNGSSLVFDAISSVNGNQTTSGDLTVGTITPARNGGIVFCPVAIAFGALREPTSPTTWFGQSPWFAQEDGGGDRLNQDNGWTYALPTSGAPATLAFTSTRAGGSGVGNWSAQFLSLVPPSVTRPMFRGSRG